MKQANANATIRSSNLGIGEQINALVALGEPEPSKSADVECVNYRNSLIAIKTITGDMRKVACECTIYGSNVPVKEGTVRAVTGTLYMQPTFIAKKGKNEGQVMRGRPKLIVNSKNGRDTTALSNALDLAMAAAQ
jgi:hypothetical protein